MADDLLIRLGDRIRKLRRSRGWTRAEMAERVGIDRSFLAGLDTANALLNKAPSLRSCFEGCCPGAKFYETRRVLDEHTRPLAKMIVEMAECTAPSFTPALTPASTVSTATILPQIELELMALYLHSLTEMCFWSKERRLEICSRIRYSTLCPIKLRENRA
jgi:DNA-binding XRE family transcriptional regulator